MTLFTYSILFVGYKRVREPKDCKYGCEYAMVCEPRVIDNEEFYMNH